MRQVARESVEHDGEQKFDRRKLAVDPENLKAPDSRPTEETEAYTLPNGYQRLCVTKADEFAPYRTSDAIEAIGRHSYVMSYGSWNGH